MFIPAMFVFFGTGGNIGLPQNQENPSIIKKTTTVTVAENVKLATDLYLPDSTGQFPCILIRSPYNKQNSKGDGERFAKEGYAVISD